MKGFPQILGFPKMGEGTIKLENGRSVLRAVKALNEKGIALATAPEAGRGEGGVWTDIDTIFNRCNDNVNIVFAITRNTDTNQLVRGGLSLMGMRLPMRLFPFHGEVMYKSMGNLEQLRQQNSGQLTHNLMGEYREWAGGAFGGQMYMEFEIG